MICGIHRGGSKGRGEQRPQLMLCSPSRIETQGLGLREQRQENVCKQPARFARQAWIYFSDHYFSGKETQLMMGSTKPAFYFCLQANHVLLVLTLPSILKNLILNDSILSHYSLSIDNPSVMVLFSH